MANVRSPAFRRRHPMANGPGRIMPDMLRVSAFEVSDPVQFFVLVEADDLARLAWLAFGLHGTLPV